MFKFIYILENSKFNNLQNKQNRIMLLQLVHWSEFYPLKLMTS